MNPYTKWLWAAKVAIAAGVVLLGFQIFGTRVAALLSQLTVPWLPVELIAVGYATHFANRAWDFRNGQKQFFPGTWLSQKMFWVAFGLCPHPFIVMVANVTGCLALSAIYFYVAVVTAPYQLLPVITGGAAAFFVLCGVVFLWMTVNEWRQRREWTYS